MRIYLISLILFLVSFNVDVNAQILHTESFSVIIDSTNKIKGSIIPDFKFQNLKEDLIEIENISDISYRFGNNALTLANKIELSKFGKSVILSGGFVYLEYRRLLESKFVLEPYSQIHWLEARGMEFKYAGGVNLRYQIYTTNSLGLYAGIGPFYEFERWNYNGVPDENLPALTPDVKRESMKLGTYLSFKWMTSENINLDFSVYHQARFGELFSTPRLASSSSIKYKVSRNLGLILRYQNIFDYTPVVPVDRLFNKIIFTIDVNF